MSAAIVGFAIGLVCGAVLGIVALSLAVISKGSRP